MYYLIGLGVFLVFAGLGSYLVYNHINPPVSVILNDPRDENNNSLSSDQLSSRINERMILINGGTFRMGEQRCKT